MFPGARWLEVVDVKYEKDGHDQGHEQSIEDVEEELMRDEVSSVPLDVLDHTKDASHQDDDADAVQDR